MRVSKPVKVRAMAREFGRRIKEAREARQLTQHELAALAGVDTMQVSRYERGLGMPAAETIAGLAGALKVSTDYLLLGKDAGGGIQEIPIADVFMLEKFREVQSLKGRDRDALLVVIDSILARREEEERVERRRRA